MSIPERETERLTIRPLGPADAAFVLELVNEPGWKRFIGDRGMRTLEQARTYVEEGPAASHAAHGFGLDRVARKEDDEPVGICGLIRRDSLDDVDLGFAMLARWEGRGYASEAGAAVLEEAEREHGLHRVVAITAVDNVASQRVLEKLGFRFERSVAIGDPPEQLELYAWASGVERAAGGARSSGT